jgi:hypothetical protein
MIRAGNRTYDCIRTSGGGRYFLMMVELPDSSAGMGAVGSRSPEFQGEYGSEQEREAGILDFIDKKNRAMTHRTA